MVTKEEIGEVTKEEKDLDISASEYEDAYVCLIKWEQKQSLKIHQQSKHEGVRYVCNQCEYSATTRGDLKRHQESLHEGVLYSCDQCKYTATERTHCNHCDYEAKRQDQLKAHISAKHEEVRFSCSLCEYQASQKRNLKSHYRSMHEGIRFKCQQCDFEAKWPNKLSAHKKKIHSVAGADNKELKCDICVKFFERSDSYKRHMKITHGPATEKKFKCSYCERAFHLKANCNRHVKIFHEGSRDNFTYQCDQVFTEDPKHVKSRFLLVQAITNQFWKVWLKLYFPSLLVRQKWHTDKRNVEVGDVCLMKDSNVYRGEWRLCEVTKAMKDGSNKVRNVQIVVKPKQSGSGPYITTKPIFINRHVSNIIVLVPANERELHEPQQVQVRREGDHVQHDVVEH